MNMNTNCNAHNEIYLRFHSHRRGAPREGLDKSVHGAQRLVSLNHVDTRYYERNYFGHN